MNILRGCSGSDSPGPNIRVGGNSGDESVYLPSGNLPSGDTYRITTSDLLSYSQSIPRWNGSLTLDVNFRDSSDPSLAVAHVRAAAAVMPWSIIESIEIGNEVDLFSENGIRNSTYNYEQYQPEFDLYQAALKNEAAVPYPRIQGAVYCCSRSDFDSSLQSYVKKYTSSGNKVLSSVSYHHYPLSVCNGKKPATISELMADSSSTSTLFPELIADVAGSGIPLYVGEGNSVSCGGQAGVSDAFASALWAIDAMFNFASYGILRWNFHGCPGGPYCAIAYADTSIDDPLVNPLYYGLWAFSSASANNSVIYKADMKSTNPFIKAWYVRDDNGAERVVLLHKDPINNAVPPSSAVVTVIPAASKNLPATAVTLSSGPEGLAAKNGLNFGGLTFDGTQNGLPSGQWSPVSVPWAAQLGGYSVTLVQGSAIILTLP